MSVTLCETATFIKHIDVHIKQRLEPINNIKYMPAIFYFIHVVYTSNGIPFALSTVGVLSYTPVDTMKDTPPPLHQFSDLVFENLAVYLTLLFLLQKLLQIDFDKNKYLKRKDTPWVSSK